jgi:riboflavin kinase/FMN adenylyltransferase
MIDEGRINTANKALGYPYFLMGKVVEGNKLGRKLGFPTANIQVDEPMKLIPRNGVYAVLVKVNEKIYGGMLNVGFRPTIELPKHERIIEVNLFDFNENIYDLKIKVAFLEWLRSEKKFDTLNELKEQISVDKKESLNILLTYKNRKNLI